MKRCEHGSDGINHFSGGWNGGVSKCDCCGATVLYVDSASYGDYIKSRTWEPKNKCGTCGGKYVDFDSRTVTPKQATIESHVMDTGGGFSYCSECQEPVDIERLESITKNNGKLWCSKCDSILVWGKITTNGGGSDF